MTGFWATYFLIGLPCAGLAVACVIAGARNNTPNQLTRNLQSDALGGKGEAVGVHHEELSA